MRRWGLLLVVCACSSAPTSAPAPAPAPQPAPAAVAPAQPTPPPPAEPAIVWQTSHQVEADSDQCKVLRLAVKKGGDVLADKRLRDDCEQDPDYQCKDTGEGCMTVAYELVDWLDLGDRRFAWVKEEGEWHDNGSVQIHLYGFACGKVTRVWGYSWMDPGSETRATVTAVGGDWKRLAAVEVEEDGNRTEHQLSWSDDECRYVRAR